MFEDNGPIHVHSPGLDNPLGSFFHYHKSSVNLVL